ncbi:transposase [Azospirillum sp. B21]|uniref:IS66 family transposase n=1 Tax=Azospirillum sp. B21 TaxID=2607496 RepID=UPI0032B5BB8C
MLSACPARLLQAGRHGREHQTRQGRTADSPLALEAVRRINALSDLERALNGKPAAERLAAHQEHGIALLAALEDWMRTERARLSRHAPVAKAMDYILTRWDGFTRFLGDGRLCLTNNAAGRNPRGIAIERKAWLFCGSDRGGQRAPIMCGLITTAKLNGVDAQAGLADVLARINDMPQTRLCKLRNHHGIAPALRRAFNAPCKTTCIPFGRCNAHMLQVLGTLRQYCAPLGPMTDPSRCNAECRFGRNRRRTYRTLRMHTLLLTPDKLHPAVAPVEFDRSVFQVIRKDPESVDIEKRHRANLEFGHQTLINR